MRWPIRVFSTEKLTLPTGEKAVSRATQPIGRWSAPGCCSYGTNPFPAATSISSLSSPPLFTVATGSSGLSTSMSEEISRSPAVTTFGPLAWNIPRLGPSPWCLKRSFFTFRTMSVTSSWTPGMAVNSCRTRSS